MTHPYFKLNYIEQQWGGEAEYHEEINNGNPYARNWRAYARETVEEAVLILFYLLPMPTLTLSLNVAYA